MPPVSDLASLTPAALAALFGYALGAKVRDWPSTVAWLEAIEVPRPRDAALTGLASEGLLILLLVTAPRVGSAGAIGWLIIATALLVRSRRANVGCGCLGAASTQAAANSRPIASDRSDVTTAPLWRHWSAASEGPSSVRFLQGGQRR